MIMPPVGYEIVPDKKELVQGNWLWHPNVEERIPWIDWSPAKETVGSAQHENNLYARPKQPKIQEMEDKDGK